MVRQSTVTIIICTLCFLRETEEMDGGFVSMVGILLNSDTMRIAGSKPI